ncbi:hypothetical protein niasHT_018051 [Heterodera trifolii]|uniref:Uncharacterized protein n=1 Tax=Heterodera trifolii TaxID=157864 RepID=A0ABD2L8D8_9BILA
MDLFPNVFQSLRKFVPSILNDCPSFHYANFNYDNLFAEFPADDNATASDGQWVAKWLFTLHPNNVPKVFPYWLEMDAGLFASKLEAFKMAFANASSPANFIVIIWILPSFADSVVPFNRTNELTREQLALKIIDHYSNRFLLIRCPIARDESKWTKWEKEAIGFRMDDQWNLIEIQKDNNDIGDERAPRRNSWPM